MSFLSSLFMGRSLWRFLMSPAGRILLVAVAFFAWTLYQRADAIAQCEAAELAEELAEANRQLELAQEIAKDARAEADRAELEMSELEQENVSLKKDIADGKVATCAIPDDVRERLLRIK